MARSNAEIARLMEFAVITQTLFRRRFCTQGWTIAHNGVMLTGASNVPVTRYHGSTIPTPWTPTPATATSD